MDINIGLRTLKIGHGLATTTPGRKLLYIKYLHLLFVIIIVVTFNNCSLILLSHQRNKYIIIVNKSYSVFDLFILRTRDFKVISALVSS